MFTIEDQVAIFNEMVSPTVVSLVKSQSKLGDRFKKSFDTIDAKGKYFTQKINFGGSRAFGARSNRLYPTPQEITPGESVLRVKRMEMFSLGFDGLSAELAEKTGSPIDPADFEQEELMKGMADDISRQLMGDGSGIIAKCTATVGGGGSKTLLLYSDYYDNPAELFFGPKQVIDIYTAAGVPEGVSKIVESVDGPNQITLTVAETWTQDSGIYNEGLFTLAEAVGKGESMGILGVVRETDPPAPNAVAGLQGLPVGDYGLWKAKLWSHGGVLRPFEEDLIIKAMQYANKRGTINVLLITEGIFRQYKMHLDEFKHLGPDPKQMWGGWIGLPFYYDGKILPMVQDVFVPKGNIIGLAEDEFTFHMTNPNWITWEKVGGSIIKQVAGQNAYVAEGHIFGNEGVRNRQPHFRITDIEEPS